MDRQICHLGALMARPAITHADWHGLLNLDSRVMDARSCSLRYSDMISSSLLAAPWDLRCLAGMTVSQWQQNLSTGQILLEFFHRLMSYS